MNLQILKYVCSLTNNLEVTFYKDKNRCRSEPLIQRSVVPISSSVWPYLSAADRSPKPPNERDTAQLVGDTATSVHTHS